MKFKLQQGILKVKQKTNMNWFFQFGVSYYINHLEGLYSTELNDSIK